MADNAASSPAAGARALVAGILVVVILSPIGYSALTRVTTQGGDAPERPDPQYTACVAETEYMRFHHWELLKGMREKVVRDGIRGDLVEVETSSQGKIKVEQSLDGCWRCHQSKVRFCDRCHNAASVHPDCFGCHYYPDVDELVLER